MLDIFNLCCEHICEYCINGDEDCYCGGSSCPFADEFEELEKLCNKIEELTKSTAESSKDDARYIPEYSY